MNFLEKLFHSHSDITERRVTYCRECGSPFTSVGEALRIIAGKKKTDMKNEVLSQQPIRRNNMRSGVMRDGGSIFRCKEGCIIIKHDDRIRCLYCGHNSLKKIDNPPSSTDTFPQFNTTFSLDVTYPSTSTTYKCSNPKCWVTKINESWE